MPSPLRRTALLGLAVIGFLVVFAGFVALGIWQLERRAWKLDLIGRVEQRVHAAATPAPGPRQWPRISAASDEYRRVAVTGEFLNGRDTRVQASTDLGAGFWILTPLRVVDGDAGNDGAIVLINRGFAPTAANAANVKSVKNATAAPAGIVTVTGLLRTSQPGGGFLRRNDPAADRWFSRDVQAIATARGLSASASGIAPYFIDADAAAAAAPPRWPAGGLTVIAFPNNHLVYALTWFALALMTAAAAWFTWRTGRMGHTERTGHAWHRPPEPPILPAEKMRGERDNGADGNVH